MARIKYILENEQNNIQAALQTIKSEEIAVLRVESSVDAGGKCRSNFLIEGHRSLSRSGPDRR
jgi:hypothetical protein